MKRPPIIPDLRGVSLDEIAGERMLPANAWSAIGGSRPDSRAIRWRSKSRRCGEQQPRESVIHLTGQIAGRTRCGIEIPSESRCRIFHDADSGRPRCATCARLSADDAANKRKDAKK